MFRLCTKGTPFRDEDIIKTPTFAENGGGIMMKVGMYSGRVTPWANFLFMTLNLSFLSYTAYFCIAEDFDFALFSSCCHYILMVVTAATFIVNCQLKYTKIQYIFRELDRGVYLYSGTMDPETQKLLDGEKALMKKRKERLSKFLIGMFFATATVSLTLFPVIFGVEAGDKDDNIHRDMPVVVWYPISTEGWPGFLWLLFTEYWIGFVVALTASGTDVPYLCFAEEGVYQLKALGLALRHVFRRARYTYEQRYGIAVDSYKDPRFSSCLKLCLKESIRHHYAILKYFKALANIFCSMLLVIMLGSTFLLCISGLLFVSPNIDTKPKFQNCCYLIAVLFHTLTFYWYGEEIQNKSLDLREHLYESGWEACSEVMSKYIIIMQDYTRRPIVITAGGFTPINLNNFGSLLSSAYSYFNLLTIMMTRE